MTEAINRELGQFVCREGNVFPVTMWLDKDGQECEPALAVRALAGEGRRWFVRSLRLFDGAVQ